jgi:hypothetical protein
MEGRNGKQVRERYINQLGPNIKRGDWTKEEDMKIYQLYQIHNSRWTEISK